MFACFFHRDIFSFWILLNKQECLWWNQMGENIQRKKWTALKIILLEDCRPPREKNQINKDRICPVGRYKAIFMPSNSKTVFRIRNMRHFDFGVDHWSACLSRDHKKIIKIKAGNTQKKVDCRTLVAFIWKTRRFVLLACFSFCQLPKFLFLHIYVWVDVVMGFFMRVF